jgi:hypothetical protein
MVPICTLVSIFFFGIEELGVQAKFLKSKLNYVN